MHSSRKSNQSASDCDLSWSVCFLSKENASKLIFGRSKTIMILFQLQVYIDVAQNSLFLIFLTTYQLQIRSLIYIL